MATRIVVPDAGQTTDELVLARWYVGVGDEVEVGDTLADIETDKAIAELESYASGVVLALLAEEGDTVTTGQTLLWLGEMGERPPEGSDEAMPQAHPEPEPERSMVDDRADAGGILATPAARVVARERAIALEDVTGSGPGGCIVRRDVPDATGGTLVEMTPMRRAVARRLEQSFAGTPHFYVAIDVDMTQALAMKEAAQAKVSINDLVVWAAAGALRDVPEVNCRLQGEAVRHLDEINVGIAVSVDDGLVVPVLMNADQLSLEQIAERSRELIANARAGRLPAEARGTFTVSNLGMYGVKSFSAIINPPEAAILAVGAIDEKVTMADAGIVVVPTLILTLSSDHRVIDGATAARFLNAVKRRLERIASTESGPE